ncbi:riboflavin biosynthesis protein RibF [bacterium]|nr:riboflavin biosynthesis protein RibF [candidate division CSSED10-310 bacterium]
MLIVSAVHDIQKPTALTLGNFDGLHRGHMSLVDHLIHHACESGLRSVMLTFDPHPVEQLIPGTVMRRICGLPEMQRVLEPAGLDYLVQLAFTPEIAAMDALTFWNRIIMEQIHPRFVIVGEDHTFGRNRQGTPSMLQHLGTADGVNVVVSPKLCIDGSAVSSTRIRELISRAAVAEARYLLGHGLFYTGTVEHGAGRGTGMGFPTANLRLTGRMLPPPGVYLSRTELPDGWHASISYLGRAPTFRGDTTWLETHILNGVYALYDTEITVDIGDRIREDRVFDSKEALIAQIRDDLAQARAAIAGGWTDPAAEREGG